MPFPLAAAIIGGSSIVSGLLGKKAGDAQADAANASVAEQRRQFDLIRQDYAPYLEAGTNALGRLSSASEGDLSAFQQSPDYNFVRSEGIRDIGNSFARGGLGQSGNALRALTQYNQNLASGEFGNWWNRQAGLAGVGQSSASDLGRLGSWSAQNVGNALMAGGNARASGLSNINNAIQGGASNFLTYLNSQPNAPNATSSGMMPRYNWRNNINWLSNG